MSSTIEDRVDRHLFEELWQWGRQSMGFERHHAADGVFLGAGFVPLRDDHEVARVVAATLTFWFWFDDRADQRRDAGSVPWDRLIRRSLQHPDHQRSETPATPEEHLLMALSTSAHRVGRGRKKAGALARWRRGTAVTFTGMQFEEAVTSGSRGASFIELLEHGFASSAIPSILAAALLSDPEAPEGDDGDAVELGRRLSLEQRLLNDLNSAEKERAEAKGHPVTNTLLRLEAQLEPALARRFVVDQLEGCRRLLEADLERLHRPRPTLVRIVRRARETIGRWYEGEPLRYTSA